jgi:hypothetical protein
MKIRLAMFFLVLVLFSGSRTDRVSAAPAGGAAVHESSEGEARSQRAGAPSSGRSVPTAMAFQGSHGAILGKAMSSLAEGEGLVLVLVSLQ